MYVQKILCHTKFGILKMEDQNFKVQKKRDRIVAILRRFIIFSIIRVSPAFTI